MTSPRFVSSVRCQTLLRYLVEATLDGRIDALKERSIGIEVFKRDLDYDTNTHPVVRVAASEVRKKLAQYYFDAANRDELRIEIPVGSYVPEFSLPAPGQDGPVVPVPAATSGRRRMPILLIALLLAFGLCGVGWHYWSASAPLESFWAPLLNSSGPVFVCTGHLRALQVQLDPQPARNPGAAATAFDRQGSDTAGMPIVALNDSVTLANIAGLLRAERKQFTARTGGNTSYEDLQSGPSVLIGALNNDWTMRLMRNLRFQFAQDPVRREWWISDQRNPGVKLGAKILEPHAPVTHDFAIVARLLEPETRQPTVIVAGLTSEGTLAAGNFATDPRAWSDYARIAPRDWTHRNLELVLSVNVIDGHPGPPRIVTSQVW